MHIKKSNYDILNFEPERRSTETMKQQPLSSLASDLHPREPEPLEDHRKNRPPPDASQ